MEITSNSKPETSKIQVWKLVDDLLLDEELLNKKKHEKSLLQLLGKLYQLDCEHRLDEEEKKKKLNLQQR